MTDEQGELDRSLLLEVTHQGGIGSDGTCSMAPEDLALTPEDWLLTRGQDCSLTRHLLQSLCTVLLYHGLPLMRVTCFVRTLHPMTSGNSVIWRRDKPDPDEIRVLRGIEDTQAFRESPLPAIFEGAAAIRRPLFDDRCPMDFPILADLKAEGATDYVAMPLTFSDGEINFVTWVADGPNGFSVEQLSLLDRLMAALSLRLEVLARKRVTRELMRIYLGEDPGRRVLEGAIERGHGETIEAIVWDRGRIHGLVNNAGGQYPAPLASITKNGFEAVVSSNLTGGFIMAREVFTQSMADHGGAIVNMLADMWRGMPMMGHSGAARSGMENLTRTAAMEWAVAGVRVNAVAPGYVASSGMDTYKGAINDVFRKLRHQIPLKRLGREAEVSSAVAWLLSEGASYVTGTTIRIDGAAMMMSPLLPIPDHNASQPYEGFHRAEMPNILKDTDNK